MHEKEGRGMKEMSSVYWKMTTKHLKELRSLKYNRLNRLRSEYQGYMGMQEIKTLVFQIGRIDAVLEARRLQTSFE